MNHASTAPVMDTWMDVAEAATILGLSRVTLRRSIERAAREESDGAVMAHLDGITARKLGRLWRVRLDAKWLPPGVRAPAGNKTTPPPTKKK